MKRWPWLRVAITAAMSLAPAAAECQVTAPSTRAQTRVLSLQTLLPETPWYMTTDRIYRQRLTDALGDQLDYYSEFLDRPPLPRPSVPNQTTKTISCASMPTGRSTCCSRHGRTRPLCGAVAGAAPVSPADRVHYVDKARPVPKSTGQAFGSHKRVARFGAACASRHTSRVPRVRHITSG